MTDKINNPHDKLFRETWSDRSNAKAFLENYLPPNVLKLVKLETLEICKDSFIERELSDFYSDMLYKVTLGKESGYIYFLFEHKSWPDGLIHLQLLEYMIKIWRLEQKQTKKNSLSIIIPLVLFHSARKWQTNNRFHSIINGPYDQLSDYIPDFRFILYDLSTYTDEEIKGTIISRVVMLLFKYVFDDSISDKLPKILSLLKNLSEKETGLQYFESLIRYLLSTIDNITTEKLKSIVDDTLSEDKGELIMTIAEKLKQEGFLQGMQQGIQQGMQQGMQQGIQQGVQQGVQKGLNQGKYELICKMLNNGIPIEEISKMTGMNTDEIKTLITSNTSTKTPSC